MILVARKKGKPVDHKLRMKTERGSKKQSAADVMELLRRGKLTGEEFCEATNRLPPAERTKLLDQLLRELRELDKSRELYPPAGRGGGIKSPEYRIPAYIGALRANQW